MCGWGTATERKRPEQASNRKETRKVIFLDSLGIFAAQEDSRNFGTSLAINQHRTAPRRSAGTATIQRRLTMNATTASTGMAEAMLAAHHHWERQRSKEASESGSLAQATVVPPPAWTIAVSREPGAGGTTIARAVGDRLGWPVYGYELLQRIAEDLGVHASLLESVDEKRLNWVQEFINSLISGGVVSDFAYRKRLKETLLVLAAHGECIIVGRGAAQLLAPETTLRVRLVGPLDKRISRVSQRFGVSREEAARRIETTDRERNRFIQDYFSKDGTDPRQYDLVLNSSRFSVNQSADVIVEALHCLREQAAPKR
jgi:cytidylate kinase